MAATRIGIYGGTFDPIHLGHLAVAEAVRESAALDRVLFVPNSKQPLKEHGPWATGDQRLRMLRAAVEGNAGFAVSDYELQQPGPSYTIVTLDALHHALPDAELRFMLGVDAATLLADWRDPARILVEYKPIVMSRAGWPGPDWDVLARIHSDARSLVQAIDVPHLAIASRDLRQRIAAGRSVRYLIPDEVLRIIEREQIYRGHAEP